MKAFEVLNLLRISRPILTNYIKQGIINAVKLPNGRYDYDDKTAYDFMNKDIPRANVLYVRVSTRKQKKDLELQIQSLKQMITYKAELVGIKIHEVEESYKSKCSSFDLEPIKKHDHYVGKRIKRGIFKGSNYLLNADVNGALNILRKVVGDGFIQNLSDRGYWFQPVRIRNIFQTSHEQFLLKSVSHS